MATMLCKHLFIKVPVRSAFEGFRKRSDLSNLFTHHVYHGSEIPQTLRPLSSTGSLPFLALFAVNGSLSLTSMALADTNLHDNFMHLRLDDCPDYDSVVSSRCEALYPSC